MCVFLRSLQFLFFTNYVIILRHIVWAIDSVVKQANNKLMNKNSYNVVMFASPWFHASVAM